MKPYEEECAVCGKVCNRYWMERITTGRRIQWLCSECFYHGSRQADYVTHRPGRPGTRENESK